MSRYATTLTFPASLPCRAVGQSSPALPLQFGRASPSGEKPFAWRMQQPERKYQLFPRDRQPAAAPSKALDPGQAYALAMGQSGDKSEKMTAVTGLRIRIKEHHNLIRRRKISVPELGPMTTVQEVTMDSRMSSSALPSDSPWLTAASYHPRTATRP
jgi:hypothetical protein